MSLLTKSYDEPKHLTDVIKCEVGPISRDVVTVKSGAGQLEIGTVLGQLTADSKFVPHVNGAADGSQTAKAILISPLDATSADQTGVVVSRLAEASRLGLVWDSSVDSEAKKDAAVAQLAAAHIIVRQGA